MASMHLSSHQAPQQPRNEKMMMNEETVMMKYAPTVVDFSPPHLSPHTSARASNEGSRRFHNHKLISRGWKRQLVKALVGAFNLEGAFSVVVKSSEPSSEALPPLPCRAAAGRKACPPAPRCRRPSQQRLVSCNMQKWGWSKTHKLCSVFLLILTNTIRLVNKRKYLLSFTKQDSVMMETWSYPLFVQREYPLLTIYLLCKCKSQSGYLITFLKV